MMISTAKKMMIGMLLICVLAVFVAPSINLEWGTLRAKQIAENVLCAMALLTLYAWFAAAKEAVAPVAAKEAVPSCDKDTNLLCTFRC